MLQKDRFVQCDYYSDQQRWERQHLMDPINLMKQPTLVNQNHHDGSVMPTIIQIDTEAVMAVSYVVMQKGRVLH
jgi:hypothetical protein